MKLLNVSQTREADAFTIQNEPIASIDLMERAANQLFQWIVKRYDKRYRFQIVCGTGNNGGDGFALARLLQESSYEVGVINLDVAALSFDAQINFDRSRNDRLIDITTLDEGDGLPYFEDDVIVIDAIFGSGLSRSVEGFLAEIIDQINLISNTVLSIDTPSGLFGEDNSGNYGSIVKADITLAIEFPKLAFFLAENQSYVGEWDLVKINLDPDFIENVDSKNYYLEADDVASLILKRNKFDHKGKFGHAFLIAGSYGKMGAAVLACGACLRSGVGLLTVHIPRLGYEILQTAVPEAMTSIDKYDKVISKIPSLEMFNAVGIGPGIGRSRHAVLALKELLSKTTDPVVIDADGINVLAENRELIEMIPANSILTPHPKEFERLVGHSDNHYHRLEKQIEFAKERNVIIVLKGAHTCIVDTDGISYYNSTGNPGMAKAGCGDALTGIILSFLAQGYNSINACKLAVYIHGLAADLAADKYGEEALLASDLVKYLGKSFKKLKKM